jgi:hypothetical protein
MSQKVYDAAVAKLGAELVHTLACVHGSVDGTYADVPAERRKTFADKLSSILDGGTLTMAQAKLLAHGEPKPKRADADPFAAIRSKAFRKIADADDADEVPKTVAEIDPVAIYARWNAARRKRDDD